MKTKGWGQAQYGKSNHNKLPMKKPCDMHMKHVLSSGLNLWQKISLQSALNLVLPMMISQLCPNHAYSQ